MNKLYYISCLLVIIISCTKENTLDVQKAKIQQAHTRPISIKADTLKINLGLSKIFWKGTKMRGLGKHEGLIDLEIAYLLTKKGHLTGGYFRVNMNSLRVTDIPVHEPIPIRNLNNHLKNEDFFEVEKYPMGSFEITKVQKLPIDSLLISGNMTLKNVTKNIGFKARAIDKRFSTAFQMDRFQWNIGDKGSWIEKTGVDKDIELRVELVLE